MKKIVRPIVAGLLFLGVLSAFFFFLINGIRSDFTTRMTKAEIEAADLSVTLVPLSSSISDWYPEKLYSPADFMEDIPVSGKGSAMFGTYRMTLKLPRGKTYGITGLSCSYAQRIYVNGALLSEVGNVADNAEDFVPRTDSYSIFFTPETDETEIIIQLAHFNNRNGYFNYVFLGEQEPVVATSRANYLSAGLIIGTLIAFAAFFFGVFLFYPAKRHILWFSLVCLFSGVYFFIFQNKDIMVLLPDLPWAVSHKAEYISLFGSHIFLVIFAVSMLGLKPKKIIAAGFFAASGGVVLYYLIAPSTFYSYHNVLPVVLYAAALFAAVAYILYRVIKGRMLGYRENIIVVSCLLLDVGACIFDIVATNRNYNVLPFATILMIFFEAIAITMQFSRTERELNLAMLREKEIGETNAMLSRMGELRNEFFSTIAHEMRTPLTVMGGYAQLSSIEIQKSKVSDKTLRNLQTVSEEAMRLSDMVTRLMDVSIRQQISPKCVRLDPKDLVADAASVCTPIFQKNGNRLEVIVETDKPIFSNAEALLQVFINLAVNASRHTKGGVIRFRVVDGDSFVIFYVENNGESISPELEPHIFEKGVSGDGGSGLGLAICRDILNQCGGDIRLDYTGERGTSFSFIAPVYEEGEHE